MIEVLKWPVASLVAFLMLILFFRGPLAGLIQRIRSIKKDGIDAGLTPAQNEAADQSGIDALMKISDTPLILEVEEGIRNNLKNKKLDLSSPAVEILIRHMAQSQINAAFESTYRLAYGSQLKVLRESNAPSGVSIESTKAYFDSVAIESKPFYDGYSFFEYIAFLLNQKLLVEKNGFYHISIRGQAFLEWMVRAQLSDRKAF